MPADVLSKYTRAPEGMGAPGFDGDDASLQGVLPAQPVTTGGLTALDGGTALMLDCRFRDGKRLAFPYSYLSRVDLDPSGAILCHYPMATLTLLGRSLTPVYAAIVNHTAIAITESESTFDQGGDAPFIERVEIAEPDHT